jgi:hypothetical protein
MINRALPVVLSGALLASCGDRQLIAEAEEAVANQLVDPNSAEFRNVQVTDDDDVCGEVNAKNRMGGYTGFSPFVTVYNGRGEMVVDVFSWEEMSELGPKLAWAKRRTLDPIYRVCFPDDPRFSPVEGFSEAEPPVEELTAPIMAFTKLRMQKSCDNGEAWACKYVEEMGEDDLFEF